MTLHKLFEEIVFESVVVMQMTLIKIFVIFLSFFLIHFIDKVMYPSKLKA
jgi:hypothetical protein